MKIQYQIFKEKNLLIQKYIGDFSIEYTNYMYKLMNEPEWKYVKKVLTDLRKVNLKPAFKNLDELIKFRVENVKNNYLDVCVVNNHPFSISLVHFYQQGLFTKGYNYKYCSTIERALSLLELHEMEGVLMNLRIE